MKMRSKMLPVGFMLLLSPVLLAQATGSITVSGSIPDAFSITNLSNATLSSTIVMGSLLPATGGTLTSGTSQIRLRSNKAYNLSAQATAISFGGAGAADGGRTFSLTDVGFGVTAVDATGANVANATGHTVAALFNYNPAGLSVTNGLTPFAAGTHGTLNNITSSTQLLSGPRISSQGNISTDNNFLLVTLSAATLPQYFTPNTSFSTTITLTIASQ